MQNTIINLNGEILSPERAKVSIFDRSYLYGDSLYEVVRTYQGRFFFLDEHLARLGKSAELCQMTLGQSLEHYKQEILRTLQAFHAQKGMKSTDSSLNSKEAYMRIVISRGVGKIGFALSCLTTPTQYTIIIQPVQTPTAEQYRKGASLQISKTRLRNDPRALSPAMKSGNYLNSILAYLEAAAENFDDALLCNADGHVTEGTTFNIFYIRRGILATPPLDIGILDGITRRVLLDIAREQGIETREVRFPPERLYEADEAIWSSSVKEIFPVTRIDGKPIGDGNPGPITQKLQKAYKARIREMCS